MNSWLQLAGLQGVSIQRQAGRVVRSVDTEMDLQARQDRIATNRQGRNDRRTYRRHATKTVHCLCGCGALTSYGWVSGHNMYGVGGHGISKVERRRASRARHYQAKKQRNLKPCACGCGELVAGTWKSGHVGRGVNGFATYKQVSDDRRRARDRERLRLRRLAKKGGA